jgi:hypothetical protein
MWQSFAYSKLPSSLQGFVLVLVWVARELEWAEQEWASVELGRGWAGQELASDEKALEWAGQELASVGLELERNVPELSSD